MAAALLVGAIPAATEAMSTFLASPAGQSLVEQSQQAVGQEAQRVGRQILGDGAPCLHPALIV
eukprot:1734132-Pyramimonas_sp.AAC.1